MARATGSRSARIWANSSSTYSNGAKAAMEEFFQAAIPNWTSWCFEEVVVDIIDGRKQLRSDDGTDRNQDHASIL